MFYFEEINGKKVMKSDLLEVTHIFTTRESMIRTREEKNLDFAADNRRIICKYLNISEDNLIMPEQMHTSNIEICIEGKSSYPNTDALILTNTSQAVFLNFADCTPVILYDKKLNIGAIAHAGWRGTAGRIASKTVQKMTELGSNPSDITAAIGAAISMCCYNVQKDVLDKLKTSVNNFDGLSEIRNGEIFVNLKEINRRQLNETGINNVDVCPYCTFCNNDLFFSYRKENATTNRHSVILYLKRNIK